MSSVDSIPFDQPSDCLQSRVRPLDDGVLVQLFFEQGQGGVEGIPDPALVPLDLRASHGGFVVPTDIRGLIEPVFEIREIVRLCLS
jgi:hypothetical protein